MRHILIVSIASETVLDLQPPSEAAGKRYRSLTLTPDASATQGSALILCDTVQPRSPDTKPHYAEKTTM
jgi:hypothetical protein